MKWNDLTMKERSDLMSLFLKAGVSSLSDMKHIYDGKQDTEYNGGTLKESKVSAKLSKNQWNDLYRKGKVSLSEIPREYQSWIEGDSYNSGMLNKINDGRNKVAKGMAVTMGGLAALIGGLSSVPALYSLYQIPLVSRAINTLGTIDGIRNAISENGVKKTIGLAKDRKYGRAAISGLGDVLDISGGIGLLKDYKVIPGLKEDFKFLHNYLKDKPRASLGEKVYNYARPFLRATAKPFRDITNPIIYKAMLLNDGQASGMGIIRNLLGRNTDVPEVKPISEVKNPFKKISRLVENYNNTLYDATHRQHLNDVYGTYLYQNLLLKNPSTLELNTDPLAKYVFQDVPGLSRYADLPVYKLGFDSPTTLGTGSSNLIMSPIKYNTKTGKVNVRGTYYKNGTNFRSKLSPTQSRFTNVNQDIGGHFVAVKPRTDLKDNVFGWPTNFFDVAVKDTQHFTPHEYTKKWRQNFVGNFPLAIMDILGDDFNLFGRGVYEVVPNWMNPTETYLNFRKDLNTLDSSFLRKVSGEGTSATTAVLSGKP